VNTHSGGNVNTFGLSPESLFTIPESFPRIDKTTANLPDFRLGTVMPTKRISMRKLREILRLRLQGELSLRQIKDSLRLSLGAVQKVTSQAEVLGLDWPSIDQLDDQQLASRFYPESDTRASISFSCQTGLK